MKEISYCFESLSDILGESAFPVKAVPTEEELPYLTSLNIPKKTSLPVDVTQDIKVPGTFFMENMLRIVPSKLKIKFLSMSSTFYL